MADNKQQTSQQDRIRVDANDSSEVEYLHQQYPFMTHQQILDAIKAAGPLRRNIVEYLNQKQ